MAFLEALGFLLLLPLVGDFAARFGGFWYFPGFFRYWFWLTLMLAGLGLLGVSWSILKRNEFHVNFVR